MAGKPKQNMVPHLCKCIYIDPATKQHALAAKANAAAADNSMQPHQLAHSNSWSHSIQASATSSSAWPSGSVLATPSPLPSPLLLSTVTPFMEPLPKCKRTSSTFEDSPLSGKPPMSWTTAMQSEFGEDFCKLLIAIRAPWNSANNPQMHLFAQKWIPGAVVPDRRTLSGPILDQEAAKVEDQLKTKLHGRLATFTTDGWKNKAKQSIVASMISVASEVSSEQYHPSPVLASIIVSPT
jgi:hypothetical protein